MGGFFNPDFLAQLIWEMPESAGLTIKELARRVDKHPTTLDAELNPELTHGKLGVITWTLCLAETRVLDSLDYIEAALGRVAYELPQPAGDMEAVVVELSLALEEFGGWMKSMARATSPESEGGARITTQEAQKNLQRLIGLIGLLSRLRAHLSALANGDRREGRA